MRRRLVATITIILLAAGAAAYFLLRKPDPIYPGQSRWVLAAPDAVYVLALDPDQDPRNVGRPNTFFDQKIIRTVSLTDPDLQRRLLTAIQQEATPKPQGVIKGCRPFYRHALIARRGNHEVQLEVCYGCGELSISEGHDGRWLDLAPGNSEQLFNQALKPPAQTNSKP